MAKYIKDIEPVEFDVTFRSNQIVIDDGVSKTILGADEVERLLTLLEEGLAMLEKDDAILWIEDAYNKFKAASNDIQLILNFNRNVRS